MIFVLIPFFMAIPSFAEVSEKTEAGLCESCVVEKLSAPLDEVQLPEIKGHVCAQRDTLINPDTQSVLERMDIKMESGSFGVILGQSTLSCLYGLGSGVVNSLKDMVMLVPTILKAMWSGAKNTVAFFSEFNLDDFKSSVENGGQKVAEFAKTTYEKFKSVVSSVGAETSEAYASAGAGGAVAALADSFRELSPHQVLKNFLLKISKSVMQFFSKEWTAFQCLPADTQSELLCKAIGYVGADVLTGKILWGNLSRSPKLIGFLDKMKASLERAPIAGKFLTKDFVKVEMPPGINSWKIDSKLSLQGQHVEVAESAGKVFARGIDPKTKKLTIYELKNTKQADVLDRIQSAEILAQQISSHTDEALFLGMANTHAGDLGDLVQLANKRAGKIITKSESDNIARALAGSKENHESYAVLMRGFSQAGTKIDKQALDIVNAHMARFGSSSNLASLKEAMALADNAGDSSMQAALLDVLEKMTKSPAAKSFDKIADAEKMKVYDSILSQTISKAEKASADVKSALKTCFFRKQK